MKICSLTRVSLIALLALMAGQAFAAPSVLLLQAQNPCGNTSTEEVLNNWGIEYRISAKVPTATHLENFSTIIVSSHQPWSFYNDLGARMPRITKWLKGGARTLEFHAASGCAEVAYDLTLPRGVTPSLVGWAHDTNTVRLPHHPLATGLPATFGPYDSVSTTDHTFTNPVGRTVTVDSERRPTLVEYCVGTGRVIATGHPVERFYSRGLDSAGLLTNMIGASVYTPGCQDITPE